METFDLRVYLLTVFWQQGHKLVDDHPGGQGIVCRRAVNLPTLPLDPAEYLMDRLRPVLEPFPACSALSVELGVVPPEASPSSTSSPDDPESSCRPRCLVSLSG
jgi:hypothetical protein